MESIKLDMVMIDRAIRSKKNFYIDQALAVVAVISIMETKYTKT